MVIFFYDFYKNLVIKDAKQEVIAILNTTKAIRNYVENIQKPVIYKLKREGKLYKDFFDPKLLSSSYIVRNIYKLHNNSQLKKNNTPYKYKLAATNPRNPKNQADKFEKKILNKFRTENIREYSTIIKENNKNYFFVAIPVAKNQKSCMRCHSTPDIAPKEMLKLYGRTAGFFEKVGDIRAIISLKIPISHIVSTHIKDFFITIFIAFAIFVIFYIFIYIIYKKNLKLQKERELLIMHQNKLASMGEMISNIAHQWKQPLAQLSFILVNIELFSDKNKLTKDKLKSRIGEANKQISFMSNTIDDFRNFFASGKSERSYAVQEAILLTEQLMNAALNKNKIILEINIKTNFILKGYKNEIVQALINIINNAKDVFLERRVKDPLINIDIFSQNSKRIITIKDNAGGISVQPIDKIFEPYFTTKHANIGTGIGLYMTKMIIEKNNNGKINVKNLHNGAVFTIIF
jgi:signal transduction histidine kinase